MLSKRSLLYGGSWLVWLVGWFVNSLVNFYVVLVCLFVNSLVSFIYVLFLCLFSWLVGMWAISLSYQ